jgi:hypothetical protein
MIFVQRLNVTSATLILLQTSPMNVPFSACLRANTIFSWKPLFRHLAPVQFQCRILRTWRLIVAAIDTAVPASSVKVDAIASRYDPVGLAIDNKFVLVGKV